MRRERTAAHRSSQWRLLHEWRCVSLQLAEPLADVEKGRDRCFSQREVSPHVHRMILT